MPWPSLGGRTIPKSPNDPRPVPGELEAEASRPPRPRKEADPERECAVTRESRPQSEMIRFVRAPDGQVMADLAGKLPGRGVWVSADRENVGKAIEKGVFSRRFKAASKAELGLVDEIEARLAERCINLIGLAKKAGILVIGFDQVRASLRKTRPAWLIEAGDGAADGREKVYSLAKALYGEVKVAGALTSAELGMALGRRGVVHALLQPGQLVHSWQLAYRRLAGFRLSPEDHWFTAGDP
ncbi:MAG: RNA-binding protein [Hyphomonadaceae bacterium]|nr:RNA-binding protein [Hyphomonadaceae bacterium]